MKNQVIKVINYLKEVDTISSIIPAESAKAFDKGYEAALDDVIFHWDNIVEVLKKKGEW